MSLHVLGEAVDEMLLVAAVSVTVLVAVEIDKLMRRHWAADPACRR